MWSNCKTSRRFISKSKKGMVKDRHLRTSSNSGQKKIIQKDRQVLCTEISLEEQIFHRQSLLTLGYGLVHLRLYRDTAICKCFTYQKHTDTLRIETHGPPSIRRIWEGIGHIPMTSFDIDGLVMSNISGPIYTNPDTFETAYFFI